MGPIEGRVRATGARSIGSSADNGRGGAVLEARRTPGQALAPVESPILDRFGDVLRRDVLVTGQVRDRARHLQHPMKTPRREAEPPQCLLEQRRARRVGRAIQIDLGWAQPDVRLPLTLHLALARAHHALAYRLRRLAALYRREVFRRHRRHFELQVDAIE